MNLENSRLRTWLTYKAARLLPAFDQPCLGKQCHHLVHGHARATILLGQIQLEGYAIAWWPSARGDLLLYLIQNFLMQRSIAALADSHE